MNEARRLSRIGPWRLLDLAHASGALRPLLFGGGVLPELGPPDGVLPKREPDQELPGSNIEDTEQRRAVERERARRWLAARAG